MSGCCSPSSGRFASGAADRAGDPRPSDPQQGRGPSDHRPSPALDVRRSFVQLDGGRFSMGTEAGDGYLGDGESPVHDVVLSPFEIAPHAVTNDEFAAFVAATDFETLAESDGWSFVFAGLLPERFPPTRAVAAAPWWRQVEGSNWRQPEGPHSSLDGRGDHPVVHVAWSDAVEFCRWSGSRLATEAEWEYAARGGLRRRRFPWGDELEPAGQHRMNVFQGTFPGRDTGADGFAGTCPVDAFEPNGFGLYNMTGNVWEWCADWFHPQTYQQVDRFDPSGPELGTQRVMRGGSYLCHASYCTRYRVGARTSNTPDSTAGNIGFRVARSVTS